jgi:hypothetical protein
VGARLDFGWRDAVLGGVGGGARVRHVFDRHDDLQVEILGPPGIDDPALPLRADEELRNPLQRPLRGGEPDALNGVGSRKVLEPLQGECEVGSSLGLSDGMDLVDDHRFGRGEDLADPGGEHQVERLGGGDEDVGRGFAHRPAFGLGGVAGPQADRDLGADPPQRRPQVALDVIGKRLQGGHVYEPDTGPQLR